MERYIDTRQGNGGKPMFQLDVPFRFLLVLCLFAARLHDVAEHFFDLLDGVGLSQLCRGYQMSFPSRTIHIFDAP